MGVPKQKRTAEEEAALKAGVVEHGAGKWRTILTDREFSSILSMRSNVDLKDKWRNINVTEIWGSRHNAKLAFKYNLPLPKIDNNHMALSTVVQRDKEVADFKPLVVSGGTCPNSMENTSRLQDFQLDNFIFESITKLKEPRGSDRESIAAYIEDQYCSTPTLRNLLAKQLKHMVASGKLTKVKNNYQIATNLISENRRSSSLLLLEGRPEDSPKEEKAVTPWVAAAAAAVAAKAVAEAEAAIAAVEAAAREADALEALAEAARVLEKAATKALQYKTLHIW